jgi:exodeoxyribonuclease-3
LFPIEAIQAAGYECVFSGQKTYNGVAILSKQKATDILIGIPNFIDEQRRVLAATVGDIRVINLYIPNGQSLDSEKYLYKLDWLQQLTIFLQEELKKHPKVIILGDFNIAPQDIDVHNPKAWEGQVLCSPAEREAFNGLLNLGFSDCFRQLFPEEVVFSWWDYRLNAFKRNMGMRIDHILASYTMAQQCQECYTDKIPRASIRPSDHAPVVAEFLA